MSILLHLLLFYFYFKFSNVHYSMATVCKIWLVDQNQSFTCTYWFVFLFLGSSLKLRIMSFYFSWAYGIVLFEIVTMGRFFRWPLNVNLCYNIPHYTWHIYWKTSDTLLLSFLERFQKWKMNIEKNGNADVYSGGNSNLIPRSNILRILPPFKKQIPFNTVE